MLDTAQTNEPASATLASVKHSISLTAIAPAPPPPPPIDFGGPRAAPAQNADLVLCDHEFVAMLNAYRHSGGLARVEELVTMVQRRSDSGVSTVARWIVDRSVICFGWQAQWWVPLFQFDRPEMMLCPHLGAVFAELRGVLDPWQLARWFVQPNDSLDGRMPVDVLPRQPLEVIAAARADRFIIDG